MEVLLPVEGEHASALFPLIFSTEVTATIQWDGPDSLESYRRALTERERLVHDGKKHMFTIIDPETGQLAGSADIRPDDVNFRGDIGLWVGLPYQGKGLGTRVVQELTDYGFEKLGMEKIEASVFCGNVASRRIFEKCGYVLEGTIRASARKRGETLDEWMLGITKRDFRDRSKPEIEVEPRLPEDGLVELPGAKLTSFC